MVWLKQITCTTYTVSQITRKLKHTNSILEYFEYFCQISILIISSYAVSKFTRFLRHSVRYLLELFLLL